MGGLALKNIVETRRYERGEFLPIAADVEYRLQKVFGRAKVVPYYKSKSSFGDLDILCESGEEWNPPKIKNLITEEFSPLGISLNDKCFSFNVGELQVDAIIESPRYFDIHLGYLSYNDLGNLMGRIAKSVFGVKYGHLGLTAPVRIDNTHQIAELEISLDRDKIFEFLGFDPELFREGFETLEDIFTYVVNSKYFHPEFYNLDKLNHINRTRNRKRQSYQDFLAFIKSNVGNNYEIPTAPYSVDEFFPEANFANKNAKLIDDALKYKAAKSRVLKIACSLYKEGIAVGVKSAKFKKYLESIGDYATLVSKMTDDEISQLLSEV